MREKVEPELRRACKKNEETLGDINVLAGVDTRYNAVEIDLDYISGEYFGRFRRHVAYSDKYVYASVKDGVTAEYGFISVPRDDTTLFETE